MNAETILTEYQAAMVAYYELLDANGNDDEVAALEETADSLLVDYDRALQAEFDSASTSKHLVW